MDECEQMKFKEFLSQLDYQKLNSLLSKSNGFWWAKFSKKISLLAEIVLSGRSLVRYDEPVYTKYFSPNEVVDFVGKFLYDINPLYAYQFYDYLNEVDKSDNEFGKCKPLIHFELKEKGKKQRDCMYVSGKVNIVLDGTIKDVVSLAHEMTHKFTIDPNRFGAIGNIFGESPSVSMEFLLCKYIKNLTEAHEIDEIILKDMKRFIDWRFMKSIYASVELLISCELLELYRKNGNHVDDDILLEYLQSNSNNSVIKKSLRSFLKLVDKKDYQSLHFLYHFRYVLGILIACNFSTKIKQNSEDLELLFKFGEAVWKSDEGLLENLDIFKEVGIPIFGDAWPFKEDGAGQDFIKSDDFLVFDTEMIEMFRKSYLETLREFVSSPQFIEEQRII